MTDWMNTTLTDIAEEVRAIKAQRDDFKREVVGLQSEITRVRLELSDARSQLKLQSEIARVRAERAEVKPAKRVLGRAEIASMNTALNMTDSRDRIVESDAAGVYVTLTTKAYGRWLVELSETREALARELAARAETSFGKIRWPEYTMDAD